MTFSTIKFSFILFNFNFKKDLIVIKIMLFIFILHISHFKFGLSLKIINSPNGESKIYNIALYNKQIYNTFLLFKRNFVSFKYFRTLNRCCVCEISYLNIEKCKLT